MKKMFMSHSIGVDGPMLKGRLIETRANICFYKYTTDRYQPTTWCSSYHLDCPFHLEQGTCSQITSRRLLGGCSRPKKMQKWKI